MTAKLPVGACKMRIGSVYSRVLGAMGSPFGITPAEPGLAVDPEKCPTRLWPTTLALLAVGVAAHLTLFSGTAEMILLNWWENGTYNHGFLIIPISIYLVWRRRNVLKHMTPKPCLWGLGFVAAAAFGWLLGNVAGVLVIEQLALILMLQAFILTVVGWRVFRAALFPIFYLIFAAPFGSFLVPPLQDFTAQFAVYALRLTGLPVYLEGLFIYIPTGSFKVAEACSGVRFLITTIALGALAANLFYKQAWRRTLLMVLSVIVPIIANGFRAFGLVMIAHLSGFELAVGADHITFGLIFLSIVLFVLLAFGSTFRERWPSDLSTHLARLTDNSGSIKASRNVALVATAFGAVLIAGAAAAYGSSIENNARELTSVEIASPAAGPGWRLIPGARTDWKPRFFGASSERNWVYMRGGETVELYTAFYRQQRQGAEIVNWRNNLADGKVWRQFTTIDRAEVLLAGKTFSLRRTYLRRSGKQRVVLFWYWVDGQFTDNPYLAKLMEIKAKLLGGRQSAGVIAIAADYRETGDEAMRLLREFLIETPSLVNIFEGAVLGRINKSSSAIIRPCTGSRSCAG